METINSDINEGGVNGTGQGVVNTNSTEYKALQQSVIAHSQKLTLEERIGNKLVSLRLKMESYLSAPKNEQIIETGDFLKEYISAIGVRNKQFANYIDIKESNLSAVLKGRRKINAELAYKLGQLFGVHPNLWQLIQSKNDMHRFEVKKNKDKSSYNLKGLLSEIG